MMFYEADDIFADMDDETKQKIRDYLANTYGWKDDKGYSYRLMVMECTDDYADEEE